MIVYKCKMCNGNLDMSEHKRLVKCNYCDTYQSVPSLLDESKAEMVNRANRYRQNGEFDRATSIYEQILRDDVTDPEIHWSIVLCKFGVEYVEDPATKRMIPTINRTQSHSILQDSDYQNAIAIAEEDTKQYYMAEADKIDAILKSIWRIAKDSEEYDVFISYKEKGPDGKRTKSSRIAQGFYEALSAAGIKTFFSRVSLASKIGSEFEPYIFSALNSAKVMLVLGTNKDEFNAPWVRNEWSRFRKLTMSDSHKRLIPCVREATIDDLPDELQPYQAQDMNIEGYEQEVLDMVKKLVSELKASVNSLNETDTEKLIKNGDTYILLKDFVTAEMIFKELCAKEPNDHRVWWGRIRAVTKDLTDTDALKLHNRDLKTWMDFIKKVTTPQIYSELAGTYTSYLKKISKQSAFEEIENAKKAREQASELIQSLQNELNDQITDHSTSVNELESSYNELDESLNTALADNEYLVHEKCQKDYRSLRVLNASFVFFCFSVVTLAIHLAVPCILGIIILIAGSIVSSKFDKQSAALKIQIEENEEFIETLKQKLAKTKSELNRAKKLITESTDCVKNTIETCNDVMENADRYLTYGSDAISKLLHAIMCSEIGEVMPMDQELFKIREHTFQKVE